MRDFGGLKVWQRSHRLTLAVYEATGTFPPEETYGLTAQLRRCSASVPANIAEGCGRSGDAELARFMLISMGSASELEYLDARKHRRHSRQTREVKRMLSTFITRLRHNILKC
ncbi:MAG TPA: four helix bundle protein [Rubrobacteraceae bacterium]|nr:four helix bundle protein [Rubrobacteraceae bacterium]